MHNSELAIAWFEMNYMKLNTDKCNFLISGNKNEYMWPKLDQDIVWESNDVKFLGITIDNNLRFDKHVSNICLKANSIVFLQKKRVTTKDLAEQRDSYCCYKLN